MDIYRTPEERFDDLPGYPFEPHYAEVEGMRMHYLDEGAGDPILLLHGEPDWSYLYRKMIPLLAPAFRVLAPDYLGFGRSDKPTDIGWYTYDRHTAAVTAWLQELDVRDATLVVHDWGGPITLRHRNDHVGSPCSRTIGWPSPSSTWARRSPSCSV